jgi:hypothetical protein
MVSDISGIGADVAFNIMLYCYFFILLTYIDIGLTSQWIYDPRKLLHHP